MEFPDGTTPVVSRLCVYHCRDEASSLSQPSTGVHAAPHILSRVVNAAPPTLHPGALHARGVMYGLLVLTRTADSGWQVQRRHDMW